MVRAAACVLALGSLALAGQADADAPRTRQPLLIVPPPQATAVAGALTELARSGRYRPILLAALQPLMRQSDDAARVRARAAALVEEGRQALVALDHASAKQKLTQALATLESGFVRYYEPRPLAQVHVLLGVAALEKARPDLARQELALALHLDPTLRLDAHYSPQVRAAFADAAQGLPPPPAPSATELAKLARLAGAPIALVLSVEPAGERVLLKGAVFARARGRYTGVESRLAEVAAAGTTSAALGAQLRRIAEASYPPPTRPASIGRRTAPPPPPPPPPRRWYRRWYAWVAVGAAIAAAVALPLALRGENVGVTARW